MKHPCKWAAVLVTASICAYFTAQRGAVYVIDSVGKPIPGAAVWVTYPSAASAPMFTTDHNGYVKIDVKNLSKIHSIVVRKGTLGGSVYASEIEWPLSIVAVEGG